MDFRSSGGAVRPGARRARFGGSPLIGLLVVSGISSMAFAALAGAIPDELLSASLLTTYGAASTMMLLLVDFTGLVISPDDYGILGHRPVASRTYLAARMAAVGVYVAAISIAIALLPSIVYAARGRLLAAPATMLAVLTCNLSTSVIVINVYVALLRWIHPARLRRAMSYFQLVAAMSFYVLYYLATRAFQSAFLERIGFAGAPWLWVIPSTWFAAFVGVASGTAARAPWIAAAGAVLVTIACVPLAAGRLSLEYAQQVGEVTAVAEPVRRRRTLRLPGFGRAEARAVALLVRAQFRFDQKFRMGVLGILPLTGFYLLMGLNKGVVPDPFTSASPQSGPGVFFAVVFVPMTLQASLTISESWRAAWIFFATPASPARVVVAAKNFVSLYFLGSYLLVLAAVWSYFFEHVWHAVVHAVFAGLLAHLLLQLTVIVKPALPFAAEPRKGERSAAMFWLILVGSMAAGTFPYVLPVVYRSALATALALGLMIATTIGVEYALRLRVNEAIGDLEFQN